ncbi:hypothetical protein PPACK8108_LOCUS22174 [Phakopsora pachyrhizi]|uniref:Uncharacterized protein n=1 Tax=Phakopsora pachyrhizi TaxID=170000 RepID=A0AAV0BL19_PHAPC|nr:hypothetical protein PPACK8108_LOCUS22174 [Phakopsora pachyrhizi]
MYSKHGHLAAPRPQPAPQQLERLLEMLQAPTPGPVAETQPSLLTQLFLSGAAEGVASQSSKSLEEEQNTPTHRDLQNVDPPVPQALLDLFEQSTFLQQPEVLSPRPLPVPLSAGSNNENSTNLLAHLFGQAQVLPPANSDKQILTTSSQNMSKGTSPAEPRTPKASNLLELLMQGGGDAGQTNHETFKPNGRSVHHQVHNHLNFNSQAVEHNEVNGEKGSSFETVSRFG